MLSAVGAVVLLWVVQAMGVVELPAYDTSAPARSAAIVRFEAGSWWNTPIPRNAPTNPASRRILNYLRTAPGRGRGCLMLAGAAGGQWGQPIYYANAADPTYSVTGVAGVNLPELASLRIPRGAEAASNRDSGMVIYDLAKNYVVALSRASYNPQQDSWTATGATVTYLNSNGLNVATGRSNDPRNRGTHRGNTGATMAVEWDEVAAGRIGRVLKVASGPEVSARFVFPMVGSDGDYRGDNPAVPPQGLRFRIKPSVDLAALDLNPEARVIARALQRYGFYIGDSGGTTALKLEDTVTEARGQLWTMSADALCGLPFTPAYWQVMPEGYDPTR